MVTWYMFWLMRIYRLGLITVTTYYGILFEPQTKQVQI
jgi:hypothetical protein